MKSLVVAIALVSATPIASAAPHDRIDAAAAIYQAAFDDWKDVDGKTPVSEVHAWSVRWLQAELALPARGAALKKAFADHVARMTDVVKAAEFDANGGIIGSELALAEARFFLAEAQRWQAQRRID